MPRPCKRRRICAKPSCENFGPIDSDIRERQIITMTLDEFESIRLIDLEGLTQEQCAQQMKIARTTAQAIYCSARAKLAECLVNGKELRIEGGEYVLCSGRSEERKGCTFLCPSEKNNKGFMPANGGKNMKIAVTYENGNVFQHFGHCENFKVYEVEGKEVKSSEVVSAIGSGHGALAGFLKGLDADVLICGGIGGGARIALADAGIELYPGVSGNADDSVNAFLNGTLQFNPNTMCNHHHHEGGHSCGEHHCGENKHGCSGNH